MSQLTEEQVLDSLRTIIDPDLRKDIVSLGFIRDLAVDGGNVSFRIVLTTPACPVKEEMEGMARESFADCPASSMSTSRWTPRSRRAAVSRIMLRSRA